MPTRLIAPLTCPRCGVTYHTDEEIEAITDWQACGLCDKLDRKEDDYPLEPEDE